MNKPAREVDKDSLRSLIMHQLLRTPLYRLIVNREPGFETVLLERELVRFNRGEIFTAAREEGKAALSVEKKTWESALFGIPVAAVTSIVSDCYSPGILDGLLDQLLDWCRVNRIQLLSYRTVDIAGTIELKTILERLLLEKGFYRVETYLTFAHDIDSSIGFHQPAAGIETKMFRPGEPVDGNPAAKQIRDIARTSFTLSRFHIEPCIDRDQANRSREDWIVNILKGRGGCVYSLAPSTGCVTGFIGHKDTILESTGHRLAYNTLELIAVHPEHQGKAVGVQLIRRYLSVLKQQGKSFSLVGTQAKNVASIRLYEKCLFKLLSCRYTYHWNMQRSR